MSICAINRPLDLRKLAVLAALLAASQPACSKGDAIAELESKSGQVAGSEAKTPKKWAATEVGAKYGIGDGVRTGAKATAGVSLNNGAKLELAEQTTIRFAVVPGNEKGFRLQVEAGSAQLIVGDKRLVFDTSVGRAVLEGGTTVRLTAGDDGNLTFAVLVGQAQLDSDEGLRTVNAGEELIVAMTMGKAQIIEEPDAAIPDAAPPDAAPPPAVLKAVVKGRRVKQQKPGSDAWEPLKAGEAELELGTRLRVPRRASVKITAKDESALIRSGEVVVGGPDGLVHVTGGGVVVTDALTQGLVAKVPGGLITATPRRGGSGATLGVVKRSGKTNISVGKGVVEIDTGKDKTLLKIGEKAVLEKSGLLTITNQAPKVADMTLRAGETAVIHDRRGRTALRINFAAKCPGEGRVELSTRRGARSQSKSVAEGANAAKVWAERGTNSYRVQCLSGGVPGKTAAKGRVYVRRDSGMQRLPRRP
ncbi:MAG: FecR domain-containing protein, partial [Deltaproteobacteria bacterium]|nr:FecR domain-containing protein [Deltaproteobacteria bacterium]